MERSYRDLSGSDHKIKVSIDQVELRIPHLVLPSSTSLVLSQTTSNNQSDHHRQSLSHASQLIASCLNSSNFQNVISLDSLNPLFSDSGEDGETRGSGSRTDLSSNKFTQQSVQGSSRRAIENVCSNTILETPLILRLGEGALEHCIPPPYRTPAVDYSLDFLEGKSNPNSRSRSIKSSRGSIRPWTKFTPVEDSSDYDLKHLSIEQGHRRGFWMIPIWKWPLTKNDLYGLYGDRISLPQWTDSELDKRFENLNRLGPNPIKWNPNRLTVFWKVLCNICERKKLGHIMSLAVISSDLNHSSKEIQDGLDLGDHIRIWSDVKLALIVRRFISDINLKVGIEKFGIKQDFRLEEVKQPGKNGSTDFDQLKWFKDCILMWFDESGDPRGYS